MTFAVHRLNESMRAALAAHFLALPMRDRCLRFGTSLPITMIAGYVDGIDFGRDAVFGVWDDRLALVAAAHLAIQDSVAELALSVLPMYRGCGVGSALFEHAMAHARNRCLSRLLMHCRSSNVPIMRIARRFAIEIAASGGYVQAHLDLHAAPATMAVEAVHPIAFRSVDSDRPPQ